ncbi:MAG: hypothetical protein RIC29_00850 [Rhodospirillaceae bacterium]
MLVDSIQLSEAYLNTRRLFLKPEDSDEVFNKSLQTCKQKAKEVYKNNFTLLIRVSSYSPTIWANISTPNLNISARSTQTYYGGVSDLLRKAKEFSGGVLNEISVTHWLSPENVYRQERRLKAPGKIFRIMEQAGIGATIAQAMTQSYRASEKAILNREVAALRRYVHDDDQFWKIIRQLRKAGMQFLPTKKADIVRYERMLVAMPTPFSRLKKVERRPSFLNNNKYDRPSWELAALLKFDERGQQDSLTYYKA